ncbi:unnamed protein product, partial [Closterium sp. NIES-54]
MPIQEQPTFAPHFLPSLSQPSLSQPSVPQSSFHQPSLPPHPQPKLQLQIQPQLQIQSQPHSQLQLRVVFLGKHSHPPPDRPRSATLSMAAPSPWKSTGNSVDVVPPSQANIVDGMWIFRVKRPPSYVARGFSQRQGVDYFQTFSPTPKMTTLRVLLHVDAQRDYELHSLDFSTDFLQGSLHEEIWLRRPPGFTGSFPAGTQWSLRRPLYGLRQAPREWHDTLRTTLAALRFTPSTTDPSLFLRTDTSLPLFYILV